MFLEGPFLRREERWEGSSLRGNVKRALNSFLPSCASHPAPGSMGSTSNGSELAQWWTPICHTSSKTGASSVDKEASEKEEPKPQ